MRTTSILTGLAAAALLAGCQTPATGGVASVATVTSRPSAAMTPALHARAFQLVADFAQAHEFGGMVQVGTFIGGCYQAALLRSSVKQPVRDCMVLDTYALRYNNTIDRDVPEAERLPFYQKRYFDQRMGRYGGPAGLTDRDTMAAYLIEGSNAMKVVAKEAGEKQPF